MALRRLDARNIRCLPRGLVWLGALLAALLLAGSRALAQRPVTGSLADDRARLAEITGDTTFASFSGTPALSGGHDRSRSLLAPVRLAGVDVNVVPLHLFSTWNSDIPYSLNDGAMWAGRGLNVSAMGGVAAMRTLWGATVRLTIAPGITWSQNRAFQIFPSSSPQRSTFSSPFHGAGLYPGGSLDLPLRFGNASLTRVYPGQSEISVSYRFLTAALTARDDWWGPGIRNTLVLSDNAPGIPRLEVGTSRFLHTPIGLVDARLVAGTLTESLFFDFDPANDYRSISAVRVRLRPAFDTSLTLGFARAVYAPIVSPVLGPLGNTFDWLTVWENLSFPVASDVSPQHADQIISVFARWVFPRAGFEVYGEHARMDLPLTPTEWLITPHRSGAYTAGLQWVTPIAGRRRHLRLQTEVTYLEQSNVSANRPVTDFYSGNRSLQGYTNRGQLIGAAIGPGGSSQWLAADYIEPRWQAGAFVGRIRWENDAMYRAEAPTVFRHDVSVLSGVRGAWRGPLYDFGAELTVARRYNYLFQNGFVSLGGYRTVDVDNVTLTFSATPR